jgi:hypothetical protein
MQSNGIVCKTSTMTHQMNAESPGITSSQIAEVNASHAIDRYLAKGPSEPFTEMRVRGLEGIRGKLDAYPDGNTQEVSGWVAVEEAFVRASNSNLKRKYTTEPYFTAAEDAFTKSLDLYDSAKDDPLHLLRIEFAMASLPLYERWAKDDFPKIPEIKVFQDDVVEIGHKIVELKEEEGPTWNIDTLHDFEGFASEIVVALAYNRRQKDGSDANPSFAIPSTYRQNMSQMSKRSGKYDHSNFRGNWDISVVGQTAGSLALQEKLQVKKMRFMLLHEGDKVYKRDYTEDVTVVSVRDHLCHSTEEEVPWDPLTNLLATAEPGAPNRLKVISAQLSRNLYNRIAIAADIRAGRDGSTLHHYGSQPKRRKR